jgi:manganese transport protein
VLLANLVAMLFQALSAKLGITDLAELLGGGIGLSLLFHIPLFAGMATTAVLVYGVLLAGRSGFRPLELIIGGLVAVIGLCYLAEMFIAPVAWSPAALHTVVPQIADRQELLLASVSLAPLSCRMRFISIRG